MAQNILTLQKLGTITLPLAVAPFQIPATKPYMHSTNVAMCSYSGLSGFASGYFGLQYVYYNNQASFSNGSNPGPLMQYIGGTINSFGICDYDMSLPNPATYGSGVNAYFNAAFVQGPQEMSYWPTAGGSFAANFVAQTQMFAFPDILLGGYVKAPNSIISQNLAYNYEMGGTPGTGVVIPQRSFYWFNPETQVWELPSIASANSLFATPNTPATTVYLQSGQSQVGTIAAKTVTIKGVKYGLVCPSVPSNAATQICYSPKHYTYFYRHNTYGMVLVNQLTTNYTGALGDPLDQNIIPISLSNAADEALLSSRTGGSISSNIVIPGGDFMTSAINTSLQPVGFYIFGDGSGYVRINLTGVPNWPSMITEQNGWGVDLSGSFWGFFGNTLFSNVGLGGSLKFAPFSPGPAMGISCQVSQCNWPWFG